MSAIRKPDFEKWEPQGFGSSKTPGTRSATIRPPTVRELEGIQQSAQKEGYDAGYEEGTARARMEALRLHTLVEQLDGACSEWDQEVAQELVQLAVGVARQIVRQALDLRPDLIVE